MQLRLSLPSFACQDGLSLIAVYYAQQRLPFEIGREHIGYLLSFCLRLDVLPGLECKDGKAPYWGWHWAAVCFSLSALSDPYPKKQPVSYLLETG
jgi:hypothetical protein